jgi:hypothetical protein
MSNVSQVGGVPDDVFISRAEQAAQLAEDAQAAAEAAQAAAEAALASTLAALAAQVMDDHADVSSAGAANGELLIYNGSNWANGLLAINGLSDVDTTGLVADDLLSWNGSNWVPVDRASASGDFLPLAGGTLTGFLTLNADPTAALHAATKAYVDAQFSTSAPYDLASYYEGVPGDSAVLFKFEIIRDCFLLSGLPISRVTAGVAATGAVSLDIRKNGANIGTIDFAAAGTVATFTFATSTNFNAGDDIEVVNAATADGTLADLAITLALRLGQTV